MKIYITLPLPLENWWFEKRGIYLVAFIRLLKAFCGMHGIPQKMERRQGYSLAGEEHEWLLLLGLSHKNNELRACLRKWEDQKLCSWHREGDSYCLLLLQAEKYIRSIKEQTESLSEKNNPLKEIRIKGLDLATLPERLRDFGLIAKSFYDLIIRNLKLRGISTRSFEDCKAIDWISPVRLALEKKEVTRDQLREIYHFLGHNSFWMKNILSTRKLRKQIPKLLYAIAYERERKQSTDSPMLAPLLQHMPNQQL